MSRLILPEQEPSFTQNVEAARAALQSEPPPLSDLGFDLPEPARPRRARLIGGVALVCAVAGAAFFARWLPLRHEKLVLAEQANSLESGPIQVDTVQPILASSSKELTLPGSVRPFQETLVFSRASGYVRKWYFDIGDRVRTGDQLAAIDTPELDQQLKQALAQRAQAQANLLQARANSGFSKQDLTRFERLMPAGVASQQELDKSRAQAEVDAANVSVTQANIDAQEANIRRLMQLKSFARVLAPFDGIVTVRSVEIGSLVTADTGSPLFKVTATDPVRVFVQVPQAYASAVRPEQAAAIRVREYPHHPFTGKVSRAAGALDSSSRTMNTEVLVHNPKNELLTGMYAEVSLSLPVPRRVFQIPATALINDEHGLRVAVVDRDNTVHRVPVVLERDSGPTIEIASGLDGSERVIKLATVDLADGSRVVARTAR